MKLLLPTIVSIFVTLFAHAQIPQNRNPLINVVLSPQSNERISPEKNLKISPTFNWNINPYFNKALNPETNAMLNPKINSKVNPSLNELINPMRTTALNPLMGGSWTGYYLFDKNGNPKSYFIWADQMVLVNIDLKGKWLGYMVSVDNKNFLYYNLENSWTGDFACSDADSGFNFFNKTGEWTGEYMK